MTRSQHRRHDLPHLYKYSTAATAKEILRNGSLRWSSPLLFNDPFDVPRELELPFTADDLREASIARIEQYIDGTATAAPGTPFAEMQAALQQDGARGELMSDLLQDAAHQLTIPLEIGMEQFRYAWLEKVNALRILCFSRAGDSPVMWAHYSADHSGVVLQFESSDERDSDSLLATEVIYRDERPNLPPIDHWVRVFLSEEEMDWDACFHECYYVKGTEWGYENEWRAVTGSLDASHLYSDMPFLPEDLREVILGSAIDPSDEAEIATLIARYPNATLYRASPDHESRRVVWERSDLGR